jgi:hypothetical protein
MPMGLELLFFQQSKGGILRTRLRKTGLPDPGFALSWAPKPP